METTTKFHSITVTATSYLYILLFTYAAVNKILDFQNFQVQLGQSPLLSAFAEYVSYGVIIAELLIVGMLTLPRFRLVALFISFFLMIVFTAYIYILLNYSSFIPCSCGGILEKLSWVQHLLFNLFFVIIAAFAIIVYPKNGGMSCLKNTIKLIIILASSTVTGIALVAILYVSSENITHHHNTFVRRFAHWPAVKIHETDLKYNSYYIAGISSDKIYLGNTTAPFLVTVLDTMFMSSETHEIKINHNMPFVAPKLMVTPPYFFIADGSVRNVYRGKITNWNADLLSKGGEYFSLIEPIDSVTLGVRTHSTENGKSILGILSLQQPVKTILYPALLQQQIDGIFDTDGFLKYSPQIKRLVYLYTYRNQFTVADGNGNIDYRGNTIDTFSHAKLDIVNIKSRKQSKLASPPVIVNRQSAVANNLFFVNSAIIGKYEDQNMWQKQASIIDTYDLLQNSYRLSFYIYNEEGKKMKSFVVHENKLYAMIGNKLVAYRLRSAITENYRKK